MSLNFCSFFFSQIHFLRAFHDPCRHASPLCSCWVASRESQMWEPWTRSPATEALQPARVPATAHSALLFHVDGSVLTEWKHCGTRKCRRGSYDKGATSHEAPTLWGPELWQVPKHGTAEGGGCRGFQGEEEPSRLGFSLLAHHLAPVLFYQL